ncbi:hypothetical protein K504DRAFT_305717 [Pleomassaria siparia CBS 279.74]|uniref:Uncharacterized protein n=1 Tax=Pleomassaria siparia CBS 279.74 TaxID=1314801 RepID=A0A6G1K6J4_9PLEO|nr:hypothetical protein K504DRAFT_305717 [Pleomassaria siparia CBS 279.74]
MDAYASSMTLDLGSHVREGAIKQVGKATCSKGTWVVRHHGLCFAVVSATLHAGSWRGNYLG